MPIEPTEFDAPYSFLQFGKFFTPTACHPLCCINCKTVEKQNLITAQLVYRMIMRYDIANIVVL